MPRKPAKKFTLTFDMGNAIFEEDMTNEVVRILGEVAASVTKGYLAGPVFDVNGNKVGNWLIQWPGSPTR